MKLELPDNAREAFQFLSIGAGTVLVIRLLILLIGLITRSTYADPLVNAIAPYQNGYVLLDPHTLVVGCMAMIPRLAVGAVFIVFVALIVSICFAMIAGLLKWSRISGAVLGARTGMLVSGCWAIYALLALPPCTVHVGANELTIVERNAFLNTIPYPFSSTERVIEWSVVEGILAGQGNSKCWLDGASSVSVLVGKETITIAQQMNGDRTGEMPSETSIRAENTLVDRLEALRHSAAH